MLLGRVLLVAVITSVGATTAEVRNKLAREYNSSIANCDRGVAGVIVELAPVGGYRRRMEGGPTRAEEYIEKLREHARTSPRFSRMLTESLLVVHGTYSTLLDGFAATLDDAMLNVILNDTEEVTHVEADWYASLLLSPLLAALCRRPRARTAPRLPLERNPHERFLPPPSWLARCGSFIQAEDPFPESDENPSTGMSISSGGSQSSPPWGLDRIDERALQLDGTFYYGSSTGANARVYVLDTGVRISHQDFGGRAVAGWSAGGQDVKISIFLRFS